MKLEKAIEVAEDKNRVEYRSPDPDYRDAIKLLVEAGKRLEEARAWSPLFGKPLLPGETEH